MKTTEYYRGRINTPDGITPFKARDIVNFLQKLDGEFLIKHNNNSVDMKSILGLVSLAAQDQTPVEIYTVIELEQRDIFKDFIKGFVKYSVSGNLEVPYE
jgi:phosphotransferase system HPr-like phosphotransfer protein